MEIWKSEYELRQFIHFATHTWKIESVFKHRTEKNPYSVFENSINQARENFDNFSLQLKEKLSDTNNWKAIEIDLRDKFIPMINSYIDWYKSHEKELQKFEPYNPYSFMLNVIEQTKREILKYFPESLPQPEKRKDKRLEITQLSEIFKVISKYKKVMEILASEGFVYSHTYKWKSKKSGFKSLIFSFLKDMEGKNYFKEDVKLNYELCKTIALNTFGIEIKSNKTYYNSVLPPDLNKIIPPETALN